MVVLPSNRDEAQRLFANPPFSIQAPGPNSPIPSPNGDDWWPKKCQLNKTKNNNNSILGKILGFHETKGLSTWRVSYIFFQKNNQI